jgi:hypothetical protein
LEAFIPHRSRSGGTEDSHNQVHSIGQRKPDFIKIDGAMANGTIFLSLLEPRLPSAAALNFDMRGIRRFERLVCSERSGRLGCFVDSKKLPSPSRQEHLATEDPPLLSQTRLTYKYMQYGNFRKNATPPGGQNDSTISIHCAMCIEKPGKELT